MPVENVTTEITFPKRVIAGDTDLEELREELKALGTGWFGSVGNVRNVDGSVSEDFMQMTSPDNQQLLAKIGDVVVVINGVYAAMSPDEYQARYGTEGGVS